ncbi:hypothetical protein [Rheinheimera sp.]
MQHELAIILGVNAGIWRSHQQYNAAEIRQQTYHASIKTSAA